MQKKIYMNSNTLIWAMLKPALRRKFQFEEINKITFIANMNEDTLNLEAIGVTKGTIIECKRNSTEMKLSENQEYINMFMEQIKEQLKFNYLNAVYLKINFKEKSCESDIFYLNENNTKQSAKLILKF
jgi:nickel-dependent lactate racemase